MIRSTVLVIVVCAFLAPAGAPSQTTEPGTVRVMTYAEAKAAGIRTPPLPSETGMRVCTDAEVEALTSVRADAAAQALLTYEAKYGEAGGPGDCQLDPTAVTVVLDASRMSRFQSLASDPDEGELGFRPRYQDVRDSGSPTAMHFFSDQLP